MTATVAVAKKKPKPVRVKRVGLYKFEDLSDKAKERAREWWRECERHDFDSESFTDDVLLDHAEWAHGISREMNCYWSLGHCQGDGVAFYGTIDLEMLCDLPKWNFKGGKKSNYPTYGLRAAIKKLLDDPRAKEFYISASSEGRNSHYHHWNSMRVEVEVRDGPYFGKHACNEWFEAHPSESLSIDHPGLREEAEVAADEQDMAPVLVYCDWLEERGVDVAQLRWFASGHDYPDQLAEDLTTHLNEYLTAVSRDTERCGYAEMDYRDGDEYIDERMEGNDWLFTEDGEFEE